jgi:hypothetical protein
VVEMVQKLVLKNEVVKVKGRVKVITVKKEDFDKVLKLTKLRIVDKEYEALIPPLDGLQKNTIDINGLSVLVQQFMAGMLFGSGTTNSVSPAQMVLTTQNNTITLSYTGNINMNSQGVTVYLQILQENGNWTYQYYYIGFDTTNSSYTVSQLEVYASCAMFGISNTYYTDLVRIAYTNASFSKTSDSYLFIVWLIEFENLPPYLVPFTPLFQNNIGAKAFYSPNYYVYFNNGNCNFTCGGNCPSASLGGFITYIQNNSVILEFPVTAPLSTGTTNLEVLLCAGIDFNNIPNVSGSTSTTLTPPVSGATFYVAIATITITYQGS